MKNEITTSTKNAFITIKSDRIPYKSSYLETMTQAIERKWTEAGQVIMDTARKAKMEVYETAATVDRNKFYEADGFKDAAEWLESAFGVKYSTAKAYIQIGNAIVKGDIPKDLDLGIDALRAITKKGVDTKALLESGEVHSGMTKKEVEAVVNSGKEVKERKARAEKVYEWKCVSQAAPAHVATESMFESASYDWVQKVKVDSGVFFLCFKNGVAIVYQRMAEVIDPDNIEVVNDAENTEQGAEDTEESERGAENTEQGVEDTEETEQGVEA